MLTGRQILSMNLPGLVYYLKDFVQVNLLFKIVFLKLGRHLSLPEHRSTMPENGYNPKDKKQQVSVRMWQEQKHYTLLEGMQIGTDFMENSMKVAQKS